MRRTFLSNGASFCVEDTKLVREHPEIWNLLDDVKATADYCAEVVMEWGQMKILGVCLIDMTEGSESANMVFFSLDENGKPCERMIAMYVADRYIGNSLFYNEAVEGVSKIMLRDLARMSAGQL